MSHVSSEHNAELKRLVDRALAEFGVRCFWNVRTDLDLISQAKLAVDRLSKHGGRKGLKLASEIEGRLRSLGERPWH